MSETKIHPTAVIDSSAKIGEGVEIGPYCVIHAGVALGAGCWLQNHVTLAGPSRIGPWNRFYAFGSIGQQTQDLKYGGEPTYLEVGEGNVFREFVTVNRSTGADTKTIIGDGGNFLAYSHIAHECVVGDRVILSNNGTLAGHVTLEDGAILGGLTAIHQFCRMGKLAITGGCSKIVQDIPPFMIADGNPAEVRGINAVGLQRSGASDEVIRQLKDAYKIVYRRKLNVAQALEALKGLESPSAELRHLIAFIEGSERGIIR
jgi:UDP-N-acetylglucosamine acyltransferase